LTAPRNGRPPAEQPPGAVLAAAHRTGAGHPVVVRLDLVNQAAGARLLAVTALGLDQAWLPTPARVGPVPAGGAVSVELALRPPSGTLAAAYPFSVAVQALDPATGRATGPAAVAESALLVDEPTRLTMSVAPGDTTAVFGRRIEVELRNDGAAPAEVELRTEVSDGAVLRLSRHRVQVPPGGIARIRGRVGLSRPRVVGARNRYPFLIAARGLGAPTSVTGSVTGRPLLGSSSTRSLALIAVIAVWLALVAVGIPKLAGSLSTTHTSTNSVATSASPTAAPSGTGKAGAGSGSGASGSGSGAGSGSGSAKGSASGAGPASSSSSGVRLNGVVTAAAPAGVTVALQPTSLVDEKAEGAQPVGESAHAMAAQLLTVGKISAQQLGSRAAGAVSGRFATVTQANGSWSFAGIDAPGYYLLTFSKPGYQTRKYIVNAADADASQPLAVSMAAGAGRLAGQITGPGGPVGGATVTISDGQNTLTTSSTSTGRLGSWTMGGLSTPGTFLVSASKDGLSLESQLVTLPAGGSQTVDLALKAGVGALVGLVDGPDSLGAVGGVGGATVTATDGTITRTATTVTSGPVGRYTLPGLPVPGSYTVTVSGDGYLPQTRRVTLAAGQARVVEDAALSPATVSLQGTASGTDKVGLAGVGLTLTGPAGTYKTMSLSDPLGSFGFSGVTPGTYVISAEQYGRITAYATVVARLGDQAPIALTLVSTPGGVLPASSHVRGRVTDARSGGQLTCDQADGYDPALPGSPANLALCRVNVGVDVSAAAVASACATPAVAHPLVVCGVDPSQEYTVPSIDEKPPVPGLLPGLHHLVIAAPGYEDATVDAQVGVDGTVEAAPVALFAAASVVGSVEAVVGDLSTGPDPGLPDDPDEPVPAGQQYAHQVNYRTCVIVVPDGSTPAAQPGCTVVPPSAPGGTASCTTAAAGGQCTLTSTADGSYRLRGLSHGSYLIYVDPQNPEYHPLPGAAIVLDRGATDRYDANLHRLGRFLASVVVPGSGGGLVSATDVPVTVSPVPAVPQPSIRTGRNGRVLIVGLAAGPHTLTAAQGANTGSLTALAGEDQQGSGELTLTQSASQVIGQVTTTYTGTSHGIADAQVTISGVVAYAGSTPIRSQVTVRTDASGCYAITADGNAPTAQAGVPAGTCSADLASLPRAQLALIAGQVDVTVSATDYQQFSLAGAAVSPTALLAASLAPAPQPISGSVTLAPASSADLPGVLVAVNGKATGSGSIDVTVQPDGTLEWDDSEYPSSNVVRPGSYQLTATLPGYTSATAKFDCALGQPCTVPSLQLSKLAGLTIATVDAGGSPVPGAVVTLTADGGPASTQTAAGGSNQVSFTSLDPRPAYRVHLQAAGYAFGDAGAGIPVTCGTASSITVAPGVQTSCTATLARLGAIAGSTIGVYGGQTQPLGGVKVSATYCGATATSLADCPGTPTGTVFSAVSGTDGSYRIAGTAYAEGLAAGGWVVDATAAGYTQDGRTFVPVTDADSAQDLDLNVNPVTLELGVRNPSGKAVTNATVSIAPRNGGSAISPTAPSDSNSRYEFSALVPTEYLVQVSGPGLITLNADIVVQVGVPTQTIDLRVDVRTNSIAGIVSGQQGSSAGATALNGVTVTLVDATANKTVATATTGGSSVAGYYSFPTTVDGSYLVEFTKANYVEVDDPVAVSGGQSVTVNETLARTTNNVTVTLTSVNGFFLTGAQATLTSADGANPPQAPQPLTGSGANWASTFNSVPSGSWTLWVSLPGQHYGSVLVAGSSTVVDSDSPYALTVSATANKPVTIALSLTEAELDLQSSTIGLAADTNPAPSSVSFTVRHGSTSVYAKPDFPTGAPAVRIWVTPGVAYTIAADPGSSYAPGWTVASSTVTPASSSSPFLVDETLLEKGASLQVTAILVGKAVVAGATVQVTPADPAVTAPADGTTNSQGKVTFPALPAGSYTVDVSSGSGSTAKSGTKTVTIDLSSNPVVVTVPVS